MADPRFPRGGGANSPGGGRQHTIFPNFPKNCMRLKEFGPGGDASLAPSLDPPLVSVILQINTEFKYDEVGQLTQ